MDGAFDAAVNRADAEEMIPRQKEVGMIGMTSFIRCMALLESGAFDPDETLLCLENTDELRDGFLKQQKTEGDTSSQKGKEQGHAYR